MRSLSVSLRKEGSGSGRVRRARHRVESFQMASLSWRYYSLVRSVVPEVSDFLCAHGRDGARTWSAHPLQLHLALGRLKPQRMFFSSSSNSCRLYKRPCAISTTTVPTERACLPMLGPQRSLIPARAKLISPIPTSSLVFSAIGVAGGHPRLMETFRILLEARPLPPPKRRRNPKAPSLPMQVPSPIRMPLGEFHLTEPRCVCASQPGEGAQRESRLQWR